MTPALQEALDDLARLAEDDDDLRALLAHDWLRYRTSPALQKLTRDAHATCARFNLLYDTAPDEARALFAELVPGAGTGIDVRPPVMIDYGARLTIGDRTFINADFMVIGGGAVTIGADCLIGPRCSIYTPNHAEDLERRLAGWELPQPVTIGSNVWLGGSVTLTPGVTIGDNSIIGAGSVVTHDIPANMLAAGNPARILRPIRTSEDSA
ncbi:sugar O-acetyltransferase [Microbacterium binotii]|uniref:sugar O-acetyltransferase n=1 Tax=Microbacterium binotii TaxID=462710 RepID=UPI001F200CC3|nr:sugar O-acetyltransferase [Microbacterium binotii]UIN31631.1 sugar O-acetyltransferase [Microbacterium binotii]